MARLSWEILRRNLLPYIRADVIYFNRNAFQFSQLKGVSLCYILKDGSE